MQKNILLLDADLSNDNISKNISTWQASFPSSPPAQKELAGSMKIFSVTALTFRMHSASLTMGSSASRTLSGMGPAKEIKHILQTKNFREKRHHILYLVLKYKF